MSCSTRLLNSAVGPAALAASLLAGASSQAAITISTDTTQNMSCSGGVCDPTASTAVLNVNDLENDLAAGNVEVTTTGTGVEAEDIRVEAGLAWSSSGALSLVANRSIAVNQAVSVSGLAGLALTTGTTQGELTFGYQGNVSFANLASSLTIEGVSYTLEGDIRSLADAIAANPSGNYALANTFDAAHKRFTKSPIKTTFNGTFEGLGNAIANLSMTAYLEPDLALFAELAPTGTIRDLAMTDVLVMGSKNVHKKHQNFVQNVGALVGDNFGTIVHDHSSGTVTKCGSCNKSASLNLGGLVGVNEQGATIVDSHSSAAAGPGSEAGGLVGVNSGTIDESYGTGAAVGTDAGGLAGNNGGTITACYATGAVNGGNSAGGLVGFTGTRTISQSYSTGSVTGGSFTYIGGFAGWDESSSGSFTNDYWDTSTSGITNLSEGAGNISDDPGIAGLTTSQFQAGLPTGFDPKVWAEKPKVNGGLPYLRDNPPK